MGNVSELQSKKRRSRSNLIRWDKLDNTANLFPSIAGESMTNVYRISVVLKENVNGKALQQALDRVLPQFELFNVRLRTGVFWYYFEENGKKAPKVEEETTFPCRFIHPNRNRSYLFRVTYYKNRINLEVFHVLTDGMGGINFLRELTYEYLRLIHPEIGRTGSGLSKGTSLNLDDDFIRNYRCGKASGFNKKRAYLIHMRKLPPGELGVMHGIMSVNQLKAHCHELGVSINDYLISCFVWSVYRGFLKGMPSGKPVRVAIPVNLRPYFDSVTTKNFFVMISAEFQPEDRDYTFDEVMTIVRDSIHSQLNKQHLEDLFSYSVHNQKNLLLRPVPLPVKNLVMRLVYNQSALANTTTITNIGNITMDEPYRDYVKRFYSFLAMSKGQELKGCICSFGDELVFSFSSVFMDTIVQKGFFRQLAQDGIDVKVLTNDVYY